MISACSSVVRANAAAADLRAFGSLSRRHQIWAVRRPRCSNRRDLKGGTIAIKNSIGSESRSTITSLLAKLV